MNITVLGIGHVGLATATCLSEIGKRSHERMGHVYAPFNRQRDRILHMDIAAAESTDSSMRAVQGADGRNLYHPAIRTRGFEYVAIGR